MIQLRVVHVLRWFELTSEWLVGEEPLREVTADELRALFELAADDPVFNVYPVGEREAAWLGARISHVFDRDAYFYVVEAQQREEVVDAGDAGEAKAAAGADEAGDADRSE